MQESRIILPMIADGEDKSSPLANRIRKNYRHLRKWAKRTETDCFRIYDRDIREYPLAIDFYAGRFCVHYFSKTREMMDPARELVTVTENALKTVFGANSEDIFWRIRARQKQTRQYEKLDQAKDFFTVHEFGVLFKINLTDYLDTGLFLDHRETRRLVSLGAANKRMLNLFAYTCSFSVHAAKAGAAFTKSVDMSNTYTAWGRDNFRINNLSATKNEIVRADCTKFLDEEMQSGARYDLIIIDPPTISRSKKMDDLFDIQEDYISLIKKSLKLCDPHGQIFFSTNSRKFQFDASLFSDECTIEEITHKTLPQDFQDKKIHRCWRLTKS